MPGLHKHNAVDFDQQKHQTVCFVSHSQWSAALRYEHDAASATCAAACSVDALPLHTMHRIWMVSIISASSTVARHAMFCSFLSKCTAACSIITTWSCTAHAPLYNMLAKFSQLRAHLFLRHCNRCADSSLPARSVAACSIMRTPLRTMQRLLSPSNIPTTFVTAYLMTPMPMPTLLHECTE